MSDSLTDDPVASPKTESQPLRSESKPNDTAPPNPYLSKPVLDWDAITAQSEPPASLESSHELRGGFWYPKTQPDAKSGPEPFQATLLATEATVDEANTLHFALMVYSALQRVTRGILADDVDDSTRNNLLGERRAYRRVLNLLGFDGESPPSLETRRIPSRPSSI